ncbi:MAG TPA: hypothetical protein VM051_07940 [Usitatibacter sp.]|nr:hypothetical protein [Usitatibacter sp.]
MRRLIVATAIFASLGFAAQASDTADVSLKNRALASAGAPMPKADAPFVYGRDPLPVLLMQEEQERRGPRGSCEAAARDLCFDAADGRVVYRPARQFMPQIDGLRAESVSLRSHRVTFKYSFR